MGLSLRLGGVYETRVDSHIAAAVIFKSRMHGRPYHYRLMQKEMGLGAIKQVFGKLDSRFRCGLYFISYIVHFVENYAPEYSSPEELAQAAIDNLNSLYNGGFR